MKRYSSKKNKKINYYVPVIILHQIEKIMTLIDSGIELSKEHQPAGKAIPQRDKDSASVSSSDLLTDLRARQNANTLNLLNCFMSLHLLRWLENTTMYLKQ